MSAVSLKSFRPRVKAFTLIELLTVMFIIAILAAVTLIAAEGVLKSSARSRARAEIQAMTTALESYKADNGSYPLNYFGATTSYASSDGSSSIGVYPNSSQVLYKSLSGKNAFTDATFTAGKSYMTFKAGQVGNMAANTFIEDPFGYAYAYNTGDTATPQVNPPYNGTGFFDLWSTGGVLYSQLGANPALTNSWISNWAN